MKNYEVFAVSVCGLHRPVNEDNIFVNGFYKEDVNEKDAAYHTFFGWEDHFIAAVFDGMGGQKDGEIASLKACAAAGEQMKAGSGPDIMINAANDAICRYNKETFSNSGSTCVLIEYCKGRFRSWNIGDSRAYRISRDSITMLSVDHTEKARRDIIGASDNPDSGNRLTQHLGIDSEEFMIEPAISEWIEPQDGDAFMLCSDGLSGVVSDEEILDSFRGEGNIEEKALSLMQLASNHDSHDNISVILIMEK